MVVVSAIMPPGIRLEEGIQVGDQPGTVVWHRRIDLDAQRQSMQRFWKFYALPAGVIIVMAGLIGGVGAAAGLLILLGLFGLLLFVWVWLRGRNERTNPMVTRDGNDLCWAKRRVPIDQVTRFSTFTSTATMNVAQTTTPGGVNATATLGKVRFVLVDGADVDFVFAELEPEQLDELRAALEGVLPGRWRPIEQLHDVL